MLRDAFAVISAPAVHADDLPRLLLEHQPTVVHFCGHGTSDGTILLCGDGGDETPVVAAGLRDLLRVAAPQARLVVLNACWTADLAALLAESVGCAVGATDRVSDQAAAAFARHFYAALATGSSVGQSFRVARAALVLVGLPEAEHLRLATGPGHDADRLFLVPPECYPTPAGPAIKPYGSAAVAARKPFTALITGLAADADAARAALRDSHARSSGLVIEVQWIRLDGTAPTPSAP